MRLPKSGGTPESLAAVPGNAISYGLGDMAVDSDDIYYAAYGLVAKVAKTGGAPIAVGGACIGSAIAVDESSIYYADAGCGGDVVRRAKAGDAYDVLMSHQYSSGLAVDQDRVYFGSSGEQMWPSLLVGIPKAGGETIPLAGGPAEYSAIALDDTRVYFASGATLESIEKNGGGLATLGYIAAPARMAVDGTHVFWIGFDGLYRQERPADTGAGAPPSGTGSLEFSWIVDRGENCGAGERVQFFVSGPTQMVGNVPCQDYAHTTTGLAAGQYGLTLQLDHGGSSTGFGLSSALPVGDGKTSMPTVDLGDCKFDPWDPGCVSESVGCVSDGVCTEEDDCTCPDCHKELYCRGTCADSPGSCMPYYDGCKCSACASRPECADFK